METTTQVEERQDRFLPTVCTCNSHRLERGMEGAWSQRLISSNDEKAGDRFPAGPSSDSEALMAYPAESLRDKDGWDFCSVNHPFKYDMMVLLSKCYNFTHSGLSFMES